MTAEDITAALRDFIAKELLVGNASHIEDDDQLLVDGHIDSLGAMRLVEYVERKWELNVPPLDITVDNFGTIALIAQYVHTRERAGPPPR